MVMEDGGVTNFKLGSFIHASFSNVLYEDHEHFKIRLIFAFIQNG